MTIEQTYSNWRNTLKKPDDSLFYYHPSLERIILGLAIYVITTKPHLGKLGKAQMLKLLHLQVPDLITYWIDEDTEGFATLFPMVMTVAEAFVPATQAAEDQYPSKKKEIRRLGYIFGHSIGAGGDMADDMAEEMLDDITTDGDEIYSDKIKEFGDKIIELTRQYGIDIPYAHFQRLIGR